MTATVPADVGELYVQQWGYVRGLARTRSPGRQLVAEEVEALVWELAVERWRYFDPNRGSPTMWLMLLIESAEQLLGKARRRWDRVSASLPFDAPDRRTSDPADEAERRDMIEHLRAAVVALPDRPQRLILDRYWNGQTLREAAVGYGRTSSAAHLMEQQTLRWLRQILTFAE